jgi:hypothetical protein
LIDFRYHLVSIVAVFLALAIGMVVGAQAIRPAVTDALNKTAMAEKKAIKSLYAHNQQLKNEIVADESFAQAAEPSLLRGLLTGERVVLVLAPDADGGTVDGVTKAIQQTGASIAGQVILTTQFFDTTAANEEALTNTAKQLQPTGIGLSHSIANPQIAGQQAAAQVIAAAIVDKDGLVPTLTQNQSQHILAGFHSAGFLQVSGPNGASALTGQATMAVVIIPGTVPSVATRGPVNLALVSLTQDLQEASKGALLAGPLLGSGPHSAIEAVTSGSAGVALTTVDNAETVVGQIIVAQALRELLSPHASPTFYGVRTGTVPSPAPSPVASPSPSSTPSVSKKKTKK